MGNANFTTSPTVDDNYGHGTHVAGIAAAATGNGLGVAGIGHRSSLLNVKVLGDDAWGASSWVAEGITWAADQGARVINMSLGYTNRSNTLEDAVDYAWAKGVLLAAAAGNSGTSRRLYPAAYANCMAVAATDDDDQRVDEPDWWASNYGDWVDVAAPGLYIYSTFPDHPYAIGKSLSYDYGSGTSMATPFVAGLAGLLFGQVPARTNAEVRALIQNTADPIPGTGTYWVHGRVNAHSAVASCTAAPAVAPDVSVALSGGDAVLTWSADAANAVYEIWISTDPTFDPDDPGAVTPVVIADTTYADTGAAAALENHFYVVRGLNACGAASAGSGRTGEFTYGLAPGMP